MEELQKQIIAIQLIQELIVDKLDSSGVFSREEFEKELNDKVNEFNKNLKKFNEENIEEQIEKPIIFFNNVIGEA
jgi:ABC-type transporter lipoprotein component MlaA